MGTEIQKTNKAVITPIELALIKNDLSALTPNERVSLYNKTCESLGLNPLTQPFGYLEFRGGKLSLYAKKDCTDQLRKIHGVSIEISSKERDDDIYTVSARATDQSGRKDEDVGCVPVKGLVGEALANAYLKAITKAKRRATLSICGLGMLDETEVNSIPDAKIKEAERAAPVAEQLEASSEVQENKDVESESRFRKEHSPSESMIQVNEKHPELTMITVGKSLKGKTIKDAWTFQGDKAMELASTILKFIAEGKPVSRFQLAFIDYGKQVGAL